MERNQLVAVLESLDGIYDGEEQVDELAHALQCAGHALTAGADAELVTAALLHDVARSPIVAREQPVDEHEIAGAAWLLPRFGDRVAWLVGTHVAAKLYLLETEPGYRELLSPESAGSALHQGRRSSGFPLDHPWWPDALRLRRWDESSKALDAVLPEVAAVTTVAWTVAQR